MEGPSDFYRELEKLRLRVGDLGCNLPKLIESYQLTGSPLGETNEDSRVWMQYQ